MSEREDARHLLQMSESQAADLLGYRRADQALQALAEAKNEPDSAKRAERLKQAQVLSNLALRDAIGEVAATLKEISNGPLVEAVEAVAEASDTMKKATNHVVRELRKSQVKPVDGQADEAA